MYGYGTTQAGIDYWLVKNSWGPNFGRGGKIKMKRGSNTCDVDNGYNHGDNTLNHKYIKSKSTE